MNLYPALRAHMGDWVYYIVKMKMRELAQEVAFASEVHTDATLDDAIQRALNESRAKTSIVDYLRRRDDRFFASVVVAALGGNPKFYPVQITDDPQFSVFKDQGLDEAFGVLTFSGGQKYYALDGQHRLKAIKTLLDRHSGDSTEAPEGFADEEISVLLIVHQEGEDANEFRQKYRRLFSSLNRYAKATDADTNIIMDEDDAFAILTRRLITEHEFFVAPGRQADSFRVLTKGKNMQSGQAHFTTLQTLYAMNEELLSSSSRENDGWGSSAGGAMEKDRRKFKQFRPDEDYLDSLYDELTVYWDAILQVLPVLKEDPAKLRQHTADARSGKSQHDLLIFWPIGQELLARMCRRLLDYRLRDAKPTVADAVRALQPLSEIDWELHRAPWRHLILTGDGGDMPFRMRNEERKEAIREAENILAWVLKHDDLNADEVAELRDEWKKMLIPQPSEEELAQMWKHVEDMRG